VYGFDTDGLEDAWRAAIGASPRVGTSNPTPVPTPTQVPTFVPVGAAPVAAGVLPTPRPTPTLAEALPTPTAAATQVPGPTATPVPILEQHGINLNTVTTVIGFGLACLVIAALLVGLPIFLTVRRRHGRRK
jgi:hypothetical protein